MIDYFYRAFEDEHRGSRELIKERLNIYRPFIEPLLKLYPSSNAIDLGCGRGEWLEILNDLGIKGLGIDLDAGMLSACRSNGLQVIQSDAISFLDTVPDNSQLVVSAFHLVEHISFESLQKLMSAAQRVLVPGGLLIMETPNPENITVATCNFYLDPSHEKPIPPVLLSFLTKFLGFSRSKLLRLQESKQVCRSKALTLYDVLGGASPDYAVVAQKVADIKVMSLSNSAFEKEYGVSTHLLAQRYSDQQNQLFQGLEEKAQQAQEKAQQAEIGLILVSSSYSWRVTAPLRWLGAQYRKLRQEGVVARSKAFVKKCLRFFLHVLNYFFDSNSRSRALIIRLSRQCGLYSPLKKIYCRILQQPIKIIDLDTDQAESIKSVDELTPAARKLYLDLSVAIKKRDSRNS